MLVVDCLPVGLEVPAGDGEGYQAGGNFTRAFEPDIGRMDKNNPHRLNTRWGLFPSVVELGEDYTITGRFPVLPKWHPRCLNRQLRFHCLLDRVFRVH